MYEECLEQELRGFLQKEVSRAEPAADWWHMVMSSVTVKAPRSRRAPFIPRFRFLLVAALISVLAIGGTIYGYDFFVKDLFHRVAPGIVDAGLAEELGMSQTVGNVTVKLERAYADSNAAIVGFTIDGAKRNYYVGNIGLSTSGGQTLKGMLGLGKPVGGESVIGQWAPDATVYVYTFDAAALGGAALDAGFLLELFISTSATTENLNEMIGPFVFDFMVPFHGGKAVEIRQTVEEAGIAIHLEKVLVSPWGTRATFKLPAEYTGRKGGTLLTGSIQTPDGDVKGTFFEGFRDGDFVKYFLGDFTEQNGQWTLTIKEIVLPGSNLEPGPHPASDTVRIQGPWVFNFETG